MNQLNRYISKMQNKMSKTILLVFAFCAMFSFASAQSVSFTGSAPRVVETGEQFRLTYKLNAKGSNFTEPKVDGFRILTGPNVSTSSSVQIVNGNMTKSVSYTYTYVLLAGEAGITTIPSATIVVKGKRYQSNTVKVEVVKGAQTAVGAQTQTPSSSVDKANIGNDKLFVAVNVNKKNLYQGENLTAEIKIYTKLPLSGFEDIKFPAFTSFWSQDIESPSQINLERENVNGQIYEVGLFKKILLFPQRSGEITIDPFEITMLIKQRVRSTNPFDDFFGGAHKTSKAKLASKPVKIKVKPLPANKPASFNGAVGSFKMKVLVDKTKVKSNEAVNLKIQVSGNGNLKLIKALKVDFPLDIDTYDAKTSLKTKATNTGVTGSTTFDYLFIPRFAGTYRIAPIEFSYFDTQTKSYKTLTSQEFVIEVERGSSDEEYTSGVVQGLTKEDVRFIGKDIRFIKSGFSVVKKQDYVFGSLFFVLAYLLSIIVFTVIVLMRRVQIQQNANQSKLKNKKANKVSKKRLRIATSFMKQDNSERFYDEVLKAIWGYLSDKLSIPVSTLSKDNVSELLAKHQVDAETQQDLMQLLDSCEFARYAPSSVSGGMDDIYKKVVSLISTLDQKIK